jgi:hypothetical protein
LIDYTWSRASPEKGRKGDAMMARMSAMTYAAFKATGVGEAEAQAAPLMGA